MALARKYQTYAPVKQPKKHPQQPKKTVIRKKRVHYSLFEVFYIISILVIGVTFALIIIKNSITLYDLNIKTQELQINIEEQQQKNNELDAQIFELSNPERILEKAEALGLKLDENNVKIIKE